MAGLQRVQARRVHRQLRRQRSGQRRSTKQYPLRDQRESCGARHRRANPVPSTSAAVRVSPASFTVDEGDSFSYTIRLATAPPHPVWLYTLTRGGDQNLNADHSGRLLAPDGWTHPDPDTDWSNYTFEWDQGATVTRTANEDADNEDGSELIDIWVERLPYDIYKPCDFVPATDKAQCRQDWDNDWANSPYLRLTGPSVAVTIRDDD